MEEVGGSRREEEKGGGGGGGGRRRSCLVEMVTVAGPPGLFPFWREYKKGWERGKEEEEEEGGGASKVFGVKPGRLLFPH